MTILTRWCKANEVPGRFLDKQDIIQVFLGLQKTVNQHIVLPNILWVNTDHVSCTRHSHWLPPLGPLIVLWLARPECTSAALLACHCLSKQWCQNGHLLLSAAWSPLQFKHLKVWGQGAPAAVASLGGLDLVLALQHQAKSLWFSTLWGPPHFWHLAPWAWQACVGWPQCQQLRH